MKKKSNSQELSDQKLVQSAQPDVLKTYFKNHKLSAAAQRMLIQRGDKELIALYIYHQISIYSPLSKTAEVDLVKKADKELIMAYIKKRFLCNVAENALYRMKDPALLELYCQKWNLNKHIMDKIGEEKRKQKRGA